jgi:recombination protein RecA
MTKNDKLKGVLNKINKKYGAEIVSKGISIEKNWFPTGIANVDWALGGGFIQGGFIELYGPPSSGKSTLALKVMANAQKAGKSVAYIDVEDAYDSIWAQKNGIDTDNLLLLNKNQIEDIIKERGDVGISAEFILQLMIDLVDTKGVDILVLDSIACLTPKDELNKDMNEEGKMGGVAKLLNRALRVMNSKNRRAATIIFINQIRDSIGGYGNPTTTPGGKAVKFYAFQRVNVKRAKDVKKGTNVIGYDVVIDIDKNKVAEPKRRAEFVFYNDATWSKIAVYLDLAKKLGSYGEGVTLEGRTYSYNGEVIAKSKDEFEEWINKNPESFEKIEKSLINSSIKDQPKDTKVDLEIPSEEEADKIEE